MKILFISRYYFPHVGGVEKHIRELSSKLLLEGHTITVLTEKYDKSLPHEEVYEGVKIIRIAFSKLKYLGLLNIWVQLWKNRKLIFDSDILHIHDVAIWYIPLKILFPQKKYYLTVHGWEGIYPVPVKNKILKKVAVWGARKTIVVGKYIEKYYQITGDKIIYGAVEPKERLNLKKVKRTLVYVGRLEKDTGLELFLEALRNVDNYHIEFCGDGPLLSKCKELGIVHGFVNPEPYFAKAEIVFASGYLTILEAMSNRCLVVAAYNNPLRKDILQMSPFKTWIEIVDKPSDVVKVLKDYDTKPSKYFRKVEQSHMWAIKHTWTSMAKDYLKLWTSFS